MISIAGAAAGHSRSGHQVIIDGESGAILRTEFTKFRSGAHRSPVPRMRARCMQPPRDAGVATSVKIRDVPDRTRDELAMLPSAAHRVRAGWPVTSLPRMIRP